MMEYVLGMLNDIRLSNLMFVLVFVWLTFDSRNIVYTSLRFHVYNKCTFKFRRMLPMHALQSTKCAMSYRLAWGTAASAETRGGEGRGNQTPAASTATAATSIDDGWIGGRPARRRLPAKNKEITSHSQTIMWQRRFNAHILTCV